MPPKSIRDPAPGKSRADLLTEIAGLPRSTFVTTAHAAAYIGSNASVMQNWRSQRRGPRYYGKNEFVRYRISDLDAFMSSRAGEIGPDRSETGGEQRQHHSDRAVSDDGELRQQDSDDDEYGVLAILDERDGLRR